MDIKFEIKSRWDGRILFEMVCGSLKLCLEAAVKSRANLSRADLSGANLSGANLYGADLSRANLSGAKNANRHLTTPLRILLDQPGKIRAYKVVNAKLQSPMHTDNPITYAVGKSYRVKDANTDEGEHCGAGINVATLSWCLSNWQEGWRLLLLEFTAKDIAAIPFATDGKFRVRRAKVVKELKLSDYDWPPPKPEEKKAKPVAAK